MGGFVPRVGFATALCYKLDKFPLAAKLGVGLKFFLLSMELNMKSLGPPFSLQFHLCYPLADLISYVPVGVAFQKRMNADLITKLSHCGLDVVVSGWLEKHMVIV